MYRDQRGFSILQVIIVLALMAVIALVAVRVMDAKTDRESMHSKKVVTQENMTEATPTPSNTIANPASTNCVNKGGQLVIQTLPNGGQYGVCMFPDNQECEEWALYNGSCPDGGIKTIGYDTPEQIYCAITGGKTTATKNATCTFDDGSKCSAISYYNGSCQKGQAK